MGNKKNAALQSMEDACSVCITKCKELSKLSIAAGLQYRDQCKQLHRFSKSLLIPLEDLADNTFTDPVLEQSGVCHVQLVRSKTFTRL